LLVAVGEFRSYVVEFLAAEVVPFRAADVAGSLMLVFAITFLFLLVDIPIASPSSLPMAYGVEGCPLAHDPLGS
jgi:hypothetical protein